MKRTSGRKTNTAINTYRSFCTRRAFVFSAEETGSIQGNQPTAPHMTTQYWLVKSEPEAYAWETFVQDGRTAWTGVRNYAARLHLNAMRPGDKVFFYASGGPKAVIGTAEVTKPAFPDTTADEPGWVAVELKAGKPLARPVTLAQIKADPILAKIALVRQGRLSVSPLAKAEFEQILKLGSDK